MIAVAAPSGSGRGQEAVGRQGKGWDEAAIAREETPRGATKTQATVGSAQGRRPSLRAGRRGEGAPRSLY